MTMLSALIGGIWHLIWLAKCFWKSPYQRTVREVFCQPYHDNEWFSKTLSTATTWDLQLKQQVIEVDNKTKWSGTNTREQVFENRFSRNPHQNPRTWYFMWLNLKEKTSFEQFLVCVLFVGVFFAGRWSV